MSQDPKPIYPYHFEGFKQIMRSNWSTIKIIRRFKQYLREEHGFNNEAQLYSLSKIYILKGLGLI